MINPNPGHLLAFIPGETTPLKYNATRDRTKRQVEHEYGAVFWYHQTDDFWCTNDGIWIAFDEVLNCISDEDDRKLFELDFLLHKSNF